jgi:hypothetical protein
MGIWNILNSMAENVSRICLLLTSSCFVISHPRIFRNFQGFFLLFPTHISVICLHFGQVSVWHYCTRLDNRILYCLSYVFICLWLHSLVKVLMFWAKGTHFQSCIYILSSFPHIRFVIIFFPLLSVWLPLFLFINLFSTFANYVDVLSCVPSVTGMLHHRRTFWKGITWTEKYTQAEYFSFSILVFYFSSLNVFHL